MDHSDKKSTSLTLVGGDSDQRRMKARRYCAELADAYTLFIDRPDRSFQAGMLVQWKPGMKNRQTPEYGLPMVVVDVLAVPFLDTKFDSGSIYFREPLDLGLGFVDEDGEFSVLHYDSRRFEIYAEDIAE